MSASISSEMAGFSTINFAKFMVENPAISDEIEALIRTQLLTPVSNAPAKEEAGELEVID